MVHPFREFTLEYKYYTIQFQWDGVLLHVAGVAAIFSKFALQDD